jgi:hypothetical protein
MKVKSLRLYQAVYFKIDSPKPKLITYVDNANLKEEIDMTVLEGIGVQLINSHDNIVVTFNNIASMSPIVDEPKKSKKYE